MHVCVMTNGVMMRMAIKVVCMKLVALWKMSMLANQPLSTYKLNFVLVSYLDI